MNILVLAKVFLRPLKPQAIISYLSEIMPVFKNSLFGIFLNENEFNYHSHL